MENSGCIEGAKFHVLQLKMVKYVSSVLNVQVKT